MWPQANQATLKYSYFSCGPRLSVSALRTEVGGGSRNLVLSDVITISISITVVVVVVTWLTRLCSHSTIAEDEARISLIRQRSVHQQRVGKGSVAIHR